MKWLRTVDSQNAHPVSNKLDSGLLCSCHLGTKKGGVTGVGEERMRGKKLGNEDPRLCNRWACFCSIIHGAVCCHWQEVAAGYDPLILSVGCTFLCSMGAHPARAYVIVLLGNRAWWVSREWHRAWFVVSVCRSPCLGSTDILRFVAHSTQPRATFWCLVEVLQFPPPISLANTHIFSLIYYLGTVIISKVLSYRCHFCLSSRRTYGGRKRTKVSVQICLEIINLFRGKIFKIIQSGR